MHERGVIQMKDDVRFCEVIKIQTSQKPTVWTNLCQFVVFQPAVIVVNNALSLSDEEILIWGTLRIISHMYVLLSNSTLTTMVAIETIYHYLCTPVQMYIHMN